MSTIDDILRAVGRRGEEEHSVSLSEDETLEIDAYPYSIKVKEHSPMFHWTVQAEDDPSDKDEGYSTNPTEDIVDFLKGDVPGGSFLDKYAFSNPENFVKIMIGMISLGEINPTHVAKLLRKIAMRIVAKSPKDLLSKDPLLVLHDKKIDSLLDGMQDKDWQARKIEDDSGLPAIEFEIGDRYSGKVMLHDMIYSYEFSIHGSPELTISGTANDLVETFREWVLSDAVAEAQKAAPEFEPETGVSGSKLPKTVGPGPR